MCVTINVYIIILLTITLQSVVCLHWLQTTVLWECMTLGQREKYKNAYRDIHVMLGSSEQTWRSRVLWCLAKFIWTCHRFLAVIGSESVQANCKWMQLSNWVIVSWSNKETMTSFLIIIVKVSKVSVFCHEVNSFLLFYIILLEVFWDFVSHLNDCQMTEACWCCCRFCWLNTKCGDIARWGFSP